MSVEEGVCHMLGRVCWGAAGVGKCVVVQWASRRVHGIE